jgi:hypothetical protein
MKGQSAYQQPPTPKQIDPPSNSQWWAGLIACVMVAVAAQSHTLPEPWSHVVSVLGTVGAAVNGYLIRR